MIEFFFMDRVFQSFFLLSNTNSKCKAKSLNIHFILRYMLGLNGVSLLHFPVKIGIVIFNFRFKVKG